MREYSHPPMAPAKAGATNLKEPILAITLSNLSSSPSSLRESNIRASIQPSWNEPPIFIITREIAIMRKLGAAPIVYIPTDSKKKPRIRVSLFPSKFATAPLGIAETVTATM